MKAEQYQAIIEGILFTMGEAVEIERLAEALELETEQVRQIIRQNGMSRRIGGSSLWKLKMQFRCVRKKSCTNT